MRETLRAHGWTALRFISIGMAVYALVLGLLVFGYANVSNCLAQYAEKAATSTAARAQAAAEDRALDAKDRAARDRAEDALDAALRAIVQTPPDREAAEIAFTNLVRVRTEVAKVRVATAAQRARNDEERRKNPPPPPPSQTC